MTLTDLIARLEAATGPDPELDKLISLELVGFDPDRLPTHWPDIGRPASPHAPYTASLDAAIALVEAKLPGWWWAVGHYGPDGLCAANVSLSGSTAHIDCEAPTAPLAILVALCRSLQAAEGSK